MDVRIEEISTNVIEVHIDTVDPDLLALAVRAETAADSAEDARDTAVQSAANALASEQAAEEARDEAVAAKEYVEGEAGKIDVAYDHSQTIGNAHNTKFDELEDTPTTVSGYGITDALADKDLSIASENIILEDLLSGLTPSNGYYNTTDGFTSSANWRSYAIDVTNVSVVKYEGSMSSASVRYLTAVNASNVKTVLLVGIKVNSNVILTIPEDTVRLEVSFNALQPFSFYKVTTEEESDGKVTEVIRQVSYQESGFLDPIGVGNSVIKLQYGNGFGLYNREADITPTFLPLLGKPLQKPTPFASLPIEVYKSKFNKFYLSCDTDYDFESETTQTYYFSMLGSDDNDGLSILSPKKSINRVINSLNDTPPTGGATFYIIGDGGVFTSNEIDNTSITFNLVVKGLNTPVLSNQISITPLKYASSNVYYAQYNQYSAPIDKTYLNEMGDFKRLKKVSSLVLCQSTPASYFTTSTSIYYHLWDSRAPDENVVHLRNGIMFNINADKFYMSNVELWGGYGGNANTGLINVDRSSVNPKIYFISDTKIVFGMESIAVKTNGNTLSIIKNIYATGSAEDNIGYYGSPSPISNAVAVEIDCKSYYAGYNNDGSNNGTTLHHGWNAIRINSDYSYNENKNVADISAAKVWMLGCKASNATSSSVNINYSFSDGCEVWFDGCTAGGSTTDLELVGSGNIIHFKGEIPLDWVITGSGTIDTYPDENWTDFISVTSPDSFIELLENSSPGQINDIKTLLGI